VSDLPKLPPLREIIARHNLRADKSFGQNFLLDQNLTDKIARVGGNLAGVHVLEVGPGPGGLTRSLLRTKAIDVTAAEIDPRAVAALQELVAVADNRLKIVAGDALHLNVSDLLPEGPRAIIANLPYNVATPILLKFLAYVYADPGNVSVMALMFQKEVAQRICAAPNSSAYGRLSIMAQWLCEAKIAFDVPPSAFVPPPKIISSVVMFKPSPIEPDRPPFALMEKIVAAAFSMRRKMVRNTLAAYLPQLEQAGIAPTARAEDLSVEDFLKIARLAAQPAG
jgi:16S rRNA (adenine1518-N6/adenine1519-N6)-dimethyltransferase